MFLTWKWSASQLSIGYPYSMVGQEHIAKHHAHSEAVQTFSMNLKTENWEIPSLSPLILTPDPICKLLSFSSDIHKPYPLFQPLIWPTSPTLFLHIPSPCPPADGLQILGSRDQPEADQDHRCNGLYRDVERQASARLLLRWRGIKR